MTNTLLSRRCILVTAACVVPVAGCSLLPDPPEAQIYRLRPQVEDPPNGALPHSRLAIDVPAVPQSLDTDRIALMRGSARFDYYADSIWTDRVPMLLQSLLVQAFEDDSRVADVGRDTGSVAPGYLLETDIRDFEARYDGPAEHPPAIVVGWALRLVKMPDRQMVGRTLVTEQAPATHNSLDSIVAAFDTASGKALNQSVTWVLRTMSQGSR